MKTFSIITACYNAEKDIKNCIESIVNSNYPLDKIEHIIVDDGSIDSTKKICESFVVKYPHIKFYSKQNGNWGSVINFVKKNKIAKNQYILICDADDIILPNALNYVDKLINNVDLFAASFYRWNGKRKTLYCTPYMTLRRHTLINNCSNKYYSPIICPQSGIMSSTIFYKLPYLRENIFYQDTILFNHAICLSNTIKFTFRPICLYKIKSEKNSMSMVKTKQGVEQWSSNFQYFEKQNWINPFVCYLIWSKEMRNKLSNDNIKFKFTSKLSLKFLPLFFRPFYRLLYLLLIKKYVK